ncbi:MAG: hypothetical protein ACI9U2_002655, partial [Bradymonadia bacterium]
MHFASVPVRQLLLSFALLAPTACVSDNPNSASGEDAGVGDMRAPDMASDADPPACDPQIEVDRERIDFAPTQAFETRSERIRVTNTAACPVQILEIGLNGARAFAVHVNDVDIARDTAPLDDPDADGAAGLSRGASFEVEVLFTPSDDAPKAGELGIQIANGALLIPLTGNQAGPCFTVDPPVLEFTSGLNESQTAEISITSCGLQPITIQSAVFAEDGDGAFTLVAERSAALPFELAPAGSPGGTTLGLTVRFAPSQPGAV